MRIILFSLILIDKSPRIASESPSRLRQREKPCHLQGKKNKEGREKKIIKTKSEKSKNNFPIRTEIKELQQETRKEKRKKIQERKSKRKSDQKAERKLNLH